MADRVLFISWGENIAGREERGLEVFDETIGFYGRMQQEGKIEGFDVSLLAPHGGLSGFIAIHGTADQLHTLRNDPEYLRNLFHAEMVVKDVRTVDGYSGNGIAEVLGIYREAIAKVPQIA